MDYCIGRSTYTSIFVHYLKRPPPPSPCPLCSATCWFVTVFFFFYFFCFFCFGVSSFLLWLTDQPMPHLKFWKGLGSRWKTLMFLNTTKHLLWVFFESLFKNASQGVLGLYELTLWASLLSSSRDKFWPTWKPWTLTGLHKTTWEGLQRWEKSAFVIIP